MRAWHLIALAAAALFAAVSPARADERILSYDSDVAVQPDSSLLVSETITVRAEGIEIRRGIYRDFPTRYKGPRGGRVRVGFELLDVTRNGAPEPAATEPIGNGVRVRIGQEDVFLAPADYRYVIRYRTTRQIGRFADYDELYWNVTGNGWDFPIDQANVRITLPRPVKLGQRAVYTGAQGSTATNGRVVAERLGEINFQSTAPLGPREGMTVAVAWPKGVVAEAPQNSRLGWWLADHGPTLVGALGLARAARLLFLCLETRRARSARRDGRTDLLAARRFDPGGDALRVENEGRQPQLRGGLGRFGRAWARPAGRGGRRLVFERQDADRTAGSALPRSRRPRKRCFANWRRRATQSSWTRAITQNFRPRRKL